VCCLFWSISPGRSYIVGVLFYCPGKPTYVEVPYGRKQCKIYFLLLFSYLNCSHLYALLRQLTELIKINCISKKKADLFLVII
jgi:hypothetical protein